MTPRRHLRTGIFVDGSNINLSVQHTLGGRLDYRKLMDFALGDYDLYRAIVYAARIGDKMEGWKTAVQDCGFEVRIKDPVTFPDGTRKADWDVGLVMDVVRMIDSIDVVALVSGDGDFMPLVRWAQDRGKIVQVIAVSRNTNAQLRELADEFKPIEVSLLLSPRTGSGREEAPAPAPGK